MKTLLTMILMVLALSLPKTVHADVISPAEAVGDAIRDNIAVILVIVAVVVTVILLLWLRKKK